MNLEREIAHDLLSIGAVFLRPDEPFTWASGIKSPIYCDNRLTLTAPAVRTDVEKGLVELIRTHYPDVEVLMGTSTAGIAHAAIVGHLMDLPMGYVRSGNKDHGRQNRIEGKLEKGQKVVVVEDLTSTAGSCIEVVEALREAGAEVLGVASIFTYGLQKGLDRLAAAPGTRASSAISCAVSYYATSKLMFTAAPGSFYPAPKVTSAVVRMEIRPTPAVQVEDEEGYFALVRAAFGQRRKTAANAIASGLGMPKDAVTAAIEAAGFDARIRPEALTLEDFAKIQSALAR